MIVSLQLARESCSGGCSEGRDSAGLTLSASLFGQAVPLSASHAMLKLEFFSRRMRAGH